ncbi:inorganic phosphate transporter [Desulfolutivibrio sulfoxidireducens]|uniref:inorganic phosphate transporter n=1 Tax=Desulfolutivibrio sulfoxidireducens TaxID=2773299 RepID=UPI00159E715B|nr:inorganic phosphate transporter [Desulfolutivibrio sulfoxidireducens]QLA15993.1 inorganic phosphate transporter [Desulfolutivibrio sulfoxidireducens]QLA20099.1 inorganic phosphate transporter [Desulfolutivibrio sulfoxidireducens]
MSIFSMTGLDGYTLFLLLASLGIALSFEFVNGFHDTANAVATVIYTKSLRARTAVVLSGICNFVGVHVGGIAVAYSIVHLLPVDLLVSVNTDLGLSMVFALLVSAILWNFGTWYLGLPASSSHTLIGSILGVGLANAWREGLPLASGINWHKAAEVGLSLLLSPILGFVCAGALLIILTRVLHAKILSEVPKGDSPPPFGLRLALIVSGLGVSVAHGSNDGQKGVGLIMLILIGILPGAYALNLDSEKGVVEDVKYAAGQLTDYFNAHRREIEKGLADGDLYVTQKKPATAVTCEITEAVDAAQALQLRLAGIDSLAQLPEEARFETRTNILCLDDAAADMELLPGTTLKDVERLESLRHTLRKPTEYAPDWVILAVSLALGIGTMVGWKRIVVTIGERIGKTRLSYGQGCAAQVVAMSTIGLADVAGLPVSTTHVLSSGVAGTMAAGKSGLQMKTLRSIAMAWVLTLPAAMLLGAGLFFLFAAMG